MAADVSQKPEEPEYVCENCGLLGPITDFNEDCRPGYTHGRLIQVRERSFEPASDEASAALEQILAAAGERFILVSIPPSMRRSEYQLLYEKIELRAKAIDEECALIGAWPVGGEG